MRFVANRVSPSNISMKFDEFIHPSSALDIGQSVAFERSELPDVCMQIYIYSVIDTR